MPLIGHRYRFMHVLAESDISQVVSAIDTYRSCAPTADGNSSPLVALKILNAQHWTLGAQEHERMRRLWRSLAAMGANGARIARSLGHFEEGAHFCLVLELYAPLTSLPPPPPPARPVAAASSSSTTTVMPLFARPVAVRGQLSNNGTSPDHHSGVKAADDGWLRPSAAMARPVFSLGALRHATAQLCGALAGIHEARHLHADLKPENVMIGRAAVATVAGGVAAAPSDAALGAQVVLIDYSNAMALHEASAYHDTFDVQTLGYRAPEVCIHSRPRIAARHHATTHACTC